MGTLWLEPQPTAPHMKILFPLSISNQQLDHCLRVLTSP
jgi:hypothetical protein